MCKTMVLDKVQNEAMPKARELAMLTDTPVRGPALPHPYTLDEIVRQHDSVRLLGSDPADCLVGQVEWIEGGLARVWFLSIERGTQYWHGDVRCLVKVITYVPGGLADA